MKIVTGTEKTKLS